MLQRKTRPWRSCDEGKIKKKDASSRWKPFANVRHVARGTVPAFFFWQQPRKMGNCCARRLMWAPWDAAGHLRWKKEARSEKLCTAGGAGGGPNLSEQETQRRVGEHSVVGIDSGEAVFSSLKQRVKNQRVTKTAFQPSSSFLFLFAC